MSLIRPLAFSIQTGDTDSDGRVLQQLDAVHRTAIMEVGRGTAPQTVSDFHDPSGVSGYYGFGADGWYYENGIQQRTWIAGDVIDDFADKVTDTERWEVASGNPDLTEGGADLATDTPFGKRLEALHTASALEIYDRKGKMQYTPSSNTGGLSGRVTTRLLGTSYGANLDNCILLCMQQASSDADYVFVGYANTSTYPGHVVYGHVTGGTPTVSGSTAVAAGTVEIEVAIVHDHSANTYRGYYSTDLSGIDYTDPNWTAVGAAVASPSGWPTATEPRVHCSMPATLPVNEYHRLSDVRVEAGSWEGNQKASWWLETLDGTNPTNLAGVNQNCPEELMCVWEHDTTGNYLTLLDLDDMENPTMWRRWQTFPAWANEDRSRWPVFSPGWMSAAEGHVAISLNTRRQQTGGSTGEERGEVWLFSLRWDTVLVLSTHDVGQFVLSYDEETERIVRDTGSWGARRWMDQETYAPQGNYSRTFLPDSGTPWAGTYKQITSEDETTAITYGVHIRKCDDGRVHLAYGIQEVPSDANGVSPYFAGVVRFDEGITPAWPRFLFQKDDTTIENWERSSEAWVHAVLSEARAIYWTQAEEPATFDMLKGSLNRRDFSSDAPNNLSTAAIHEDTTWNEYGLFNGRTYHMSILDSDPVGSEIVLTTTGWIGGSFVTALWYDSATPSASDRYTYGHSLPSESFQDDFKVAHPRVDYPRWIEGKYEDSDSLLKLCRTTRSATKGAKGYSGSHGGSLLSMMTFEGTTNQSLKHTLTRGIAIQQGDFELTLEGYLQPVYAPGVRDQVIESMSPMQTATVGFELWGERDLEAELLLRVTGGVGYQYEATVTEHSNAGKTENAVEWSVATALMESGVRVGMQIQRSSSTWYMRVRRPDTGVWRTIQEIESLRVPLVVSIRTMVDDVAYGSKASFWIDWEHILLQPTGRLAYQEVTYSKLNSRLASVGGAIALRDHFPANGSGSLILLDGPSLPGFLPYP